MMTKKNKRRSKEDTGCEIDAVPTISDARIVLIKATQVTGEGQDQILAHRVIAIDGNATLLELGYAILSAFDFDHVHRFGFYSGFFTPDRKRTVEIYLRDDGSRILNRPPGVDEATIASVFVQPEKEMFLFYESGTGWIFTVRSTGTVRPDEGIMYPSVVKSYTKPLRLDPDTDDKTDVIEFFFFSLTTPAIVAMKIKDYLSNLVLEKSVPVLPPPVQDIKDSTQFSLEKWA
jgi:hypothetical protein